MLGPPDRRGVEGPVRQPDHDQAAGRGRALFPVARLTRAAALLGAAFVLAAAAPDPASRPGTLARLPDGRRINFRCTGVGAPTVIFEGGFAATSLGWGKVTRLVAPTHRACTYDRAGAGFSDPGPEPRDGAAIARDLDDGLRAAGIKGPFVVVGHSAGALYIRLFADRRPKDVVGLVLVDPSIEHQDHRLAALFGPGTGSIAGLRARSARCFDAATAGTLPSTDPALVRCVPPTRPGTPPETAAARRAEALRPSTWAAQVAELDMLWTATSDEVAAGRTSYGALPLVVLTAGDTYKAVPEPARTTIATAWAGFHAELAARSTRGVQRTVAGSGHLMMNDAPEAVAAAVAEVVRSR